MYFQPLAANPGLDRRAVAMIKPTLSAEVALRAAYGEAMHRPWADLPLSCRDTDDYALIRKNRRRDLEAILRSGAPTESRKRALDLVCALCEESTWAAAGDVPFDDPMHPSIDLFAAETGCLMAWAIHLGVFSARVQCRILHELRARLFTPMISHDDYPCFSGTQKCHLAVVCDVIAAALLAETDNARLYTILRRLSRVADELINAYRPRALAEEVSDWAAATALWQLFRNMAGPSAGRALPPAGWLDRLMLSHVGGGVFIDPMGEGMCRGINAMDIYLMGRAASDDAVVSLGAAVYRAEKSDLSPVNARMITNLTPGIISEMRPVPRLRHGAAAGGAVMLARGGALTAEMHGAGRGCSGGLFIALDNCPIIVPLTGSGPVINGLGQNGLSGAGDWEFRDDRADMSVDLTRCYPAAAGARFYQRTLMLDRGDAFIRVIDMLETDRPGSIEYAFATPETARLMPGGAMLGSLRAEWESATPRITHRDDGMFRNGLDIISLQYDLRPGSNMLSFTIRAD